MLTAFPILSHPSKNFLIQKHPWWGFSNVNCLVEHEQVRMKVRRSRPHAAYCPLLVCFVEDCHRRKAGGPKYQFFVVSSWVPTPPFSGAGSGKAQYSCAFENADPKTSVFWEDCFKPRTQSILSRAGCVILASMREEGFLQQTELLVMELKYPVKMYLVQRQQPLEFCRWEVGVESLKLIQCYAVCIF